MTAVINATPPGKVIPQPAGPAVTSSVPPADAVVGITVSAGASASPEELVIENRYLTRLVRSQRLHLDSMVSSAKTIERLSHMLEQAIAAATKPPPQVKP